MLIGMLHNRKDPRKVSRAYLYSAIAKIEGADFFYFTTKGVDFETRTIKGKYYEKGRWHDKVYPFPDVVINSANQKTKKQNEIYYKLEKMIPYTSYPVGSKLYVYSKLKKSDYLRQFLIPYKKIETYDDVFEFLDRYKEVIVKPIRGHHGESVVKIKQEGSLFTVHERNKVFNLNKEELINYLDKLPKQKLVQKYIQSTLKSGESFDFRLHLQKNKNNEWRITIIIPRIGTKNRIITNISQGNQMMEFDKFLRNEYGKDAPVIKELIESFALQFSNEFENQYPYNFDELGIDIGLDNERHIWVYEVNWRPGHVFIEVITAKNAIQYAIYLAKKRRLENEKTISE